MATAKIVCEPVINLNLVLNQKEAAILRSLVQNSPHNIEEESPESYALREVIFKSLKQAGIQ